MLEYLIIEHQRPRVLYIKKPQSISSLIEFASPLYKFYVEEVALTREPECCRIRLGFSPQLSIDRKPPTVNGSMNSLKEEKRRQLARIRERKFACEGCALFLFVRLSHPSRWYNSVSELRFSCRQSEQVSTHVLRVAKDLTTRAEVRNSQTRRVFITKIQSGFCPLASCFFSFSESQI